MPQKKLLLSGAEILSLREAGVPLRTIAKEAGTSHVSILRALAKLEKDKTRTGADFKGGGLETSIDAPRREDPISTWSLDMISEARDDQLRGIFKRPVRLAEALRTDDAMYVAYHNRIAPQVAIPPRLIPHDSARGKALLKRAALSIRCPRSTLMSCHGALANHGVAILYNRWLPRADGTRVDFQVECWPLEHVRYNNSTEQLETSVRGGPMTPIIHADGRWTIVRKFQVKPWAEEAAVLPGAGVWAAHSKALTDWSGNLRSHGLARLIGELPPGVTLANADNSSLSPEAAGFLRMLQQIVTGQSQVGIKPSGAKTEWTANNSAQWQTFVEMVKDRRGAAASIYLGTDAILGAVGGAPGVDISQLLGLASSKLQGDFEAIESAWRAGVSEPWAAINAGDSTYAPWLAYAMPDPDAMRKVEEESKRHTAFMNAIKERQDRGFTVDQPVVDQMADLYGINPIPQLAAVPSTKLEIAPTQRALYTFANEARRSDGLQVSPEFEGKTLAQLEAEAKVQASVDPNAPPTTATPPAQNAQPAQAAG